MLRQKILLTKYQPQQETALKTPRNNVSLSAGRQAFFPGGVGVGMYFHK